MTIFNKRTWWWRWWDYRHHSHPVDGVTRGGPPPRARHCKSISPGW